MTYGTLICWGNESYIVKRKTNQIQWHFLHRRFLNVTNILLVELLKTVLLGTFFILNLLNTISHGVLYFVQFGREIGLYSISINTPWWGMSSGSSIEKIKWPACVTFYLLCPTTLFIVGWNSLEVDSGAWYCCPGFLFCWQTSRSPKTKTLEITYQTEANSL